MRSNHNIQILRTFKNLSKAYAGLADGKKAVLYARKLLERATSSGARQYIRDGFELCSELFNREHNNDSAYFYYRRFISIRDSIAMDMQLRNIAVGQMKTWKEKQDVQIRLLQNEKKIKSQQAQLLLYTLLAIIILGLLIFWNIILKRRNAVNRARALEDSLKVQNLEAKNARMQFENEKVELEMQAFRAQMNPHFIFNSLNAINRFILKNDKTQASAYLTRFSRLVRMILHHSQESLISMESELEALRLYLELEALRFDNYFTYVIHVDPSLDTTALQITPLIIQPYAENAIWHGLMHKQKAGVLTIDISQEDDMLICRIIDDGIGRKQAVALKSKSASSYKSMGMRITGERISRMTPHTLRVDTIEIRDIVLPNGAPGGTEIILKIPVIYA